MAEMLNFSDSPYLRLNMDTGNTFIAGQDPVAFLSRFENEVSHVHIKDVSPSLAAAARGELTGIAVSNCAVGGGVFDGVLSIECKGQGGPMIERSPDWLRQVLAEAQARSAPKSGTEPD